MARRAGTFVSSRAALNVTPADVAAASTVAVHTLNSGDVIVELRQRVAGLDVLGSDVKVLMRGDHQLVAISGRPRATRRRQTAIRAIARGGAGRGSLRTASARRFRRPASPP